MTMPRCEKTCRPGSRHTTRDPSNGCPPDRPHTVSRHCGRRRPIRPRTPHSWRNLLTRVSHTCQPDTRPRTGLVSPRTCPRDSRRSELRRCCHRRTDPFHRAHRIHRLRVHTCQLDTFRHSGRQWLSKCLRGTFHIQLRLAGRGPSCPQGNQSTLRSRQVRSSRRRTLHTALPQRYGWQCLLDRACTSHSHPQSCQLSTAVRSTRTADRHQLVLPLPA